MKLQKKVLTGNIYERDISPGENSGNTESSRTYDGMNILSVIKGEDEPKPRRLFWRLQGQADGTINQ